MSDRRSSHKIRSGHTCTMFARKCHEFARRILRIQSSRIDPDPFRMLVKTTEFSTNVFFYYFFLHTSCRHRFGISPRAVNTTCCRIHVHFVWTFVVNIVYVLFFETNVVSKVSTASVSDPVPLLKHLYIVYMYNATCGQSK